MSQTTTNRGVLGLAPHPLNRNRRRHTRTVARLARWLAFAGIIGAGLIIIDQAGKL